MKSLLLLIPIYFLCLISLWFKLFAISTDCISIPKTALALLGSESELELQLGGQCQAWRSRMTT